MSVLQIVFLCAVYLVSFACLILHADYGLQYGKITFSVYKRNFLIALVPLVNTSVLTLRLGKMFASCFSAGYRSIQSVAR